MQQIQKIKLQKIEKALKGSESQKEDIELSDDFKIKFKEAEKRFCVKLQQVKTELNKAIRIIQRKAGEGEDVNLDQLLFDENEWKAELKKQKS